MKKISLILLSTFFVIIGFGSCAVNENITFQKDGRMSYNMTFDASELMNMFPDKGMSSGTYKDSIISFADIIKKDEAKIIGEHPELKADLENIAPFYIRLFENPDKKEYLVSIYGDFKDATAFNNAFASMGNLVSKAPDIASERPSSSTDIMKWIGNTAIYSWDGKTMTRQLTNPSPIIGDEVDDPDAEDAGEDSMSEWNQFFAGSKMIVKYHFPKKVESVSNPDAMLSQDGKSVIIEYPGTVFTQNPEKANVEIKMKK